MDNLARNIDNKCFQNRETFLKCDFPLQYSHLVKLASSNVTFKLSNVTYNATNLKDETTLTGQLISGLMKMESLFILLK